VTSVSSQEQTAPRAEPPSHGPARPTLRNSVEWSDNLSAHVRELLRHRDLLYMVTQREIKVRYKQTVLGALWAVLQPFSLMVVFTVFFSLYAGLPSDGIPYPLFTYAALLPWTFFSTALSFSAPSLIANSHIITKIYFPREIIPLSSVLAALVDFSVASVVFVGLLAFYRISPTWNVLYVVPILMLQLTFTTAACLLLAAFTVLYRDVRFTLPLLLQIWMFATPILYPLSVVPESGRVFYQIVNPMAVVVDAYRRAVLQGQPPDLAHLATAGMISLVLLLLGYRYFKRLEREFADIV
jgi:lipopolysaccharide transport system permease protein